MYLQRSTFIRERTFHKSSGSRDCVSLLFFTITLVAIMSIERTTDSLKDRAGPQLLRDLYPSARISPLIYLIFLNLILFHLREILIVFQSIENDYLSSHTDYYCCVTFPWREIPFAFFLGRAAVFGASPLTGRSEQLDNLSHEFLQVFTEALVCKTLLL